MSAPDVLDVLRAADPARRLAADPVRRSALLEEILAAHPAPAPVPRRRRRIVLAVAVVALVGVPAGWAVYAAVSQSSTEVAAGFDAATRRIPLPPGASWRRPQLDERGVYAGERTGLVLALGQATCAWFAYRDGARTAAEARAASAGFVRVRALMPLHPAGAPEDAGGFDASTLALLDRAAASARRGDLTLLRSYLAANCR